MLVFAIRRLVHAIVILFGVSLLVFVMLHLTPSDPIQAVVGNYPVPAGFREQLTRQYHLDQPLWTQYFYFLKNAVTGHLGYSFASQQSVTGLIFDRLPNTLLLAGAGFAVGTTVGVVVAIATALTRHRFLDSLTNSAVLGLFSIPSFWLGQTLVIVLAVKLRWFPTQGMGPLMSTASGLDGIGQRLIYLALPALVYAIHEGARVVRIGRASVLETAGQPYVTTAIMKGLRPTTVIRRHIARNAVLPVVTAVGYNFGLAIGGSVLIETVFSWPGVGLLLINAVRNGDNQVVMGITLFVAASVLVVNFLVDLAYAWLDPRSTVAKGARV